MKELLLILIPSVAAGLAAVWPNNRTRPILLPITGMLHVILCLWMLVAPPPELHAWLSFDPLARAVLPAVSILFLACAAYGVPYLRLRSERPNRVFVSLFLAMLAFMSLAHQARHLGLLWISVEAVTLSTVPLIHFNNTARAYEATWKYLLVGGTGIALSLLGSFALGYASLHGGGEGDLTFSALIDQGAQLSSPWVLTAWVLILVGYGTKMGLAPMHTWKPDAYGEAPGIVGAMMAGGVTTVAFIAILRVRAVVDAAGADEVTQRTLLIIGLFSVLVAALFTLATKDFKRMLAYSSIEHMGILMVGASLGGAGLWAAFFHLWNNAMTKGALFLTAGNLRRAAGARTIDEVRGMAWLTPRTTVLFVTGLFAITACPPFGPFFSELRIVKTAIGSGQGAATGFLLFCLLMAFCGMSRIVFAVIDGRPHPGKCHQLGHLRETVGVLVPPTVLLLFSIILGLFTPSVLQDTWDTVVQQLEPGTRIGPAVAQPDAGSSDTALHSEFVQTRSPLARHVMNTGTEGLDKSL